MEKVGKAIKIFFTVSVIIFIVALLIRVFQSNYEALDDINITDSFKEAYAQNGDVRTHAIKDTFSENGAVYAYSFIYIEQSGYVQFNVRYNVRHINEIIEKYPDFSEDKIHYTLTDTDGNTYIPNVVESDARSNYKYFKLEFQNVDFSKGDLTVNMILDGLDFDGGSLVVHYADSTYVPYEFSSKEQKILK